MIPARYQQLLLVFFMTLLMGSIILLLFEFQATDYKTKTAPAFFSAGLQRFMGTYTIVVPVVVLVKALLMAELNPEASRCCQTTARFS